MYVTCIDIIKRGVKQIDEYYECTLDADGNTHQLYLDLDDGSLRVNTEASTNSWLQRDEGGLVLLCQTCYPVGSDMGDACDDDRSEFDDEIERLVSEALINAHAA